MPVVLRALELVQHSAEAVTDARLIEAPGVLKLHTKEASQNVLRTSQNASAVTFRKLSVYFGSRSEFSRGLDLVLSALFLIQFLIPYSLFLITIPYSLFEVAAAVQDRLCFSYRRVTSPELLRWRTRPLASNKNS